MQGPFFHCVTVLAEIYRHCCREYRKKKPCTKATNWNQAGQIIIHYTLERSLLSLSYAKAKRHGKKTKNKMEEENKHEIVNSNSCRAEQIVEMIENETNKNYYHTIMISNKKREWSRNTSSTAQLRLVHIQTSTQYGQCLAVAT